jgi:hypothetical protein
MLDKDGDGVIGNDDLAAMLSSLGKGLLLLYFYTTTPIYSI